ncbi:hypothetical protein FPOA_11639 [Fusarium poae]|uniref:Uncharacterized protein n=1 Tax=Fusarium poae TaxID=36050 RepID=A0A1B8AI16_FUSPO|nr:hypothetical protein FPOA_11639 [Fusarium poae]
MDETEESFARTRAEIKAFEKSIGNDPIKLELLKVDFWIATLTPGDGMADFRDSAKLLVQSPNQEEKGAGDSDEYVCDNENENSRVREDESTVASGYDQPQFIRFLERLNAETVSRHHAPYTGPIPVLKQDISLFHHQQHAVAAALYAKDSPFKGMILTEGYDNQRGAPLA